MKLSQNISKELIEFECDSATWYMKRLTLTQVKSLQSKFKSLEENPDDLSPLMVLFTDVLVGDDGEQFDEIKDGLTFDELCDMIPVTTLQNLADEITQVLAGKKQGN